jgi:hypothetical protein
MYMQKTLFFYFGLSLFLAGCISQQGATEDDPNLNPNSNVNIETGGTDGGEITGGISQGGSLEEVEGGIPDEEMQGGEVEDTPEPTLPSPPPPPEDLRPCDRFCERVEGCLYPQCDAIQSIPPQQFCQGWCRGGDQDWLNSSADLTCEDFTQRIYGFSPEIRAMCSQDDPNEDQCASICDFGEVCGIVSDECQDNCNQLGFEGQLCFSGAVELGDCQRFIQCINNLQDTGGGRGDGGRPQQEEVCGYICEREANCLFNECNFGSVTDEVNQGCFEECINSPLREEAIQERLDQACNEVAQNRATEDPEFGERCFGEDTQICSLVCSEQVVGCGLFEQEECETQCTQWDDANFYCLSNAEQCGDIERCFAPVDEQARCRQSCIRIQTCLEEACPVRFIPPEFSTECTADCFDDPPSIEDVEEWEALSCSEVRTIIYDDNRGLRRLCEGGTDFRTTPEECVELCEEQGLDECIIGERLICLSACSSFTRDQYECALGAERNCEAIDQCLVSQ